LGPNGHSGGHKKLKETMATLGGQLLGNFTMNLAESWMHMRCKFDGGKVVNRSQSGSFQHRCMGAGVRQDLGLTWGPTTWSALISSEANEVFKRAASEDEKKVEKDRKRKGAEIEKANRRKRNYAKSGMPREGNESQHQGQEGLQK